MQEGREVEGKSVIRIIPMNIYYYYECCKSTCKLKILSVVGTQLLKNTRNKR